MLGLEFVYNLWFESSRRKHSTVKQDDLIKDLSSVCQGLSTSLLPCIENFISNAEESELEKIESLSLITKDLSCKSRINALEKIKEVMESIVNDEYKYKRVISNVFSNVTTDKTITIRELAVMNLIDTFSVFESYSYDLVFDINAGLSSNFEISKMTSTRMLRYIDFYIKIVKELHGKNADKITKIMEDLGTSSVYEIVELPEGMKEEVLKENNHEDGLFSSFKNFLGMDTKPITKSGFIGNPIYHLGMLWVDFQKYRNDKRILAKQATEQILLELKMKRSESYDPKVEKQIEFYSQRLHELEYKIAQYEKQS